MVVLKTNFSNISVHERYNRQEYYKQAMDSKLIGKWKQTALTRCHNHAPFDPAAHQPTEIIECSSLWSNMKRDNSNKVNNRS